MERELSVEEVEARLGEVTPFLDAARAEMGRVLVGQPYMVERLLIGLLANGHVLLEGVPGLAKTTAVKALAQSLHLDFSRIQFTPDLLPADVLGTQIYQPATSEFTTRLGPIFANVLLADEINRAPPKTQAALLQAMNERTVTIDGTDHVLGGHFHVIATQNPIEQQGTYPLPEAQNDRFMFKLLLDFPGRDDELEILRRHALQPLDFNARTADVEKVISAADVEAAHALVDGIRLDEKILAYIVDLIRATRTDGDVREGASTRAADTLAAAVRASAALAGRDYAIPDDVQALFLPTLRHRILLGPTAEIEGRTPDDVLSAILSRIEVPR